MALSIIHVMWQILPAFKKMGSPKSPEADNALHTSLSAKVGGWADGHLWASTGAVPSGKVLYQDTGLLFFFLKTLSGFPRI